MMLLLCNDLFLLISDCMYVCYVCMYVNTGLHCMYAHVCMFAMYVCRNKCLLLAVLHTLEKNV